MKSLGAEAEDGTLQPTANITGQPISSEPMDTSEVAKSRPALAGQGADRERASIDSSMGRLVLGDGKSRYVSNSFWANLNAEVDDLKGFLHDDSDEDADSPRSTPMLSPISDDHGFIFHHASSPGRDVHLAHPPPELIEKYWRVYEENVDPLTKMLHLPTLREYIDTCKENPEALSRGVEALLFSVYFAAISSLPPDGCLSLTGETEAVLSSRYRRAAERALATANFLVSEELVVMQAFVCFMLTLRRHEDPRVLWTLTGLLVRMAVTLGLHRDGSQFDLSPFSAEVRRRLWWQIVNLDIRLAEDHGSDVTILELASDTKFPLNLHDRDFHPDMPSTAIDAEGVTEMTFSLIRFQVSTLSRRLSYVPPPSRNKPQDPARIIPLQEKERLIQEFDHSIQMKYLRYCDVSNTMHWVISTMCRLVVCKMWLTIYQPFQRLDGGVGLPQEKRDRLYMTSLECLEYSHRIETEVRLVKWVWLFKSISHWHALAYVLNELCHRTQGPTVQRAWRAVDAVVVTWGARLSPQKKDHMWRPLRKLMAKAMAARDREVALENALSKAGNSNSIKAEQEHDASWNSQAPANGVNIGPIRHVPHGRTWPENHSHRPVYGSFATARKHGTDSMATSSTRPDAQPGETSWSNGASTSRDYKMEAGSDRADSSNVGEQQTQSQHQSTRWANINPSNLGMKVENEDFAADFTGFDNAPGLETHPFHDSRTIQPQSGYDTDSFSPSNPDFIIPQDAPPPNTNTFTTTYDPTPAFTTDFPSFSQPQSQSQSRTYQQQSDSQSQPNAFQHDGPMVSGLDLDFDADAQGPPVQWADWDNMIHAFEMETAHQTPGIGDVYSGNGGGFGTPGPGADMGVAMGGMANGGTSGVDNGMANGGTGEDGMALSRVSSKERRMRVGDSWFWL